MAKWLRQRSAKPPFIGSTPIAASNSRLSGEIGRHTGLKILRALKPVPVQVRPSAPSHYQFASYFGVAFASSPFRSTHVQLTVDSTCLLDLLATFCEILTHRLPPCLWLNSLWRKDQVAGLERGNTTCNECELASI